MLIVPGMVFTIEPMLNMGVPDVFIDEEDGWTVVTEDEKPRFPDVKLQQSLELMRQLEKEEFKMELPAVICGDFNSEPTSAV